MTPEQKIKWATLVSGEVVLAGPATGEAIDAAWDELCEADGQWDLESEMRGGEVETGLPCECSRHYESKSVAAKMPDGSWVGWTYWYGGGKHGEPEEVEWIKLAYFLDCKEEERTMVVRTFTKTEGRGT